MARPGSRSVLAGAALLAFLAIAVACTDTAEPRDDDDAAPGAPVFDFDQEPRRPRPVALTKDCEGPIWDPPDFEV